MLGFIFTLSMAVLVASASAAQDRFEDVISAEVLPGWLRSDGSRMAALRLSLAPGWKTYWRAPGDAGIPPRFDWRKSRNLKGVAIHWPAPAVFDQNGMRSVGYENTFVIPLRIAPASGGESIRLRGSMELGICSDICVPHALSFDATLDGQNTTPTPAIAAALASQPYSAAEAGVTSAACAISPTPDGLQIEARVEMPSAGGKEYVVIEPGLGEIWVSEADTRRYGGEVVATSDMVNVNGGPIALDRSAIRITVLGSKYAVDIRGCSAG
ncbi:MAG: protein-disulfide reductase DsbD domain-containing protein [Pseudomonadota bacterium]